jgi:hypothetical protein
MDYTNDNSSYSDIQFSIASGNYTTVQPGQSIDFSVDYYSSSFGDPRGCVFSEFTENLGGSQVAFTPVRFTVDISKQDELGNSITEQESFDLGFFAERVFGS